MAQNSKLSEWVYFITECQISVTNYKLDNVIYILAGSDNAHSH